MDKFAKLIRKARSFLITTHVLPDGDGLGSEMALHHYLRKVGKTSRVVNSSPTPAKFKLVDPRNEIHLFDPAKPLPEADVILVLDTSEWKMLGPMAEPLKATGVPVVFVDHHVSDHESPEDHLIDERYGSTGELVYDLLRHLKADVDAEMALAVYVAIVTDTGSFRFKRTTAQSHLVAAELLQKGVRPESVHQSIYAHDSLAKVRLFGHVLQNIKATPDERIAWLTVPRDVRLSFGATIEDTEAYVNQLTFLETVEIGMLFREEDEGVIKVSLRGRGEVPVIGIAKKFGGGGHRHAAGLRLKATLEEAVRVVTQEARTFLEEIRR